MSCEGFMLRLNARKNDKKRNAKYRIPEEVTYVRNLSYGPDPKYHTLDLCYPRDAEDDLPVIISVHGGGYVYGSSSVYQFYCADLAKRGFLVVNFNYRLAPKHRFPAPLEDLSRVTDWILSHQYAYPFDTENVFLVGDSAGAQIASNYAAIYANEEYRSLFGFEKPEITIRAVALCCGFYDLKGRMNVKGIIRDYLGKHPEKYGEKLNVLDHIREGYPPTYLFTSHGDFLIAECEPMADLLKERGIECVDEVYGDEKTGHVFHVDIEGPYAARANDDVTAFF
ncbi:MAG: alpha/beta hydrolase, partial [Lachnospiraceae bacterium]|nr:alpha/beta hydrolase [Lachnospiraceae bacterium]